MTSSDPRRSLYGGAVAPGANGFDLRSAFSGGGDLAAASGMLDRFRADAQALKGLDPAGSAAFTPGPSALEEKRRRAFLDAPDTAAGMRNVRSLLAQEAGLGAGPQWNRSVKELEAAAGRAEMARAFTALPPSPGGGAVAAAPGVRGFQTKADLAPQANRQAAAIPDQPAGRGLNRTAMAAAFRSPQLVASSGEALAAAFNNQLQGAGADAARRSAVPLSVPASDGRVSYFAPGKQGDTERALAAAAAIGEQFPITEGQLALAAQNAGGMGRGGRFKPGNTMPLPQLDPSMLPPLNSRYSISGAVPGFFSAGMV